MRALLTGIATAAAIGLATPAAAQGVSFGVGWDRHVDAGFRYGLAYYDSDPALAYYYGRPVRVRAIGIRCYPIEPPRGGAPRLHRCR